MVGPKAHDCAGGHGSRFGAYYCKFVPPGSVVADRKTMPTTDDRLAEIESRLDDLEEENEQLRNENDQLHDRVDDLEDSNERLHQENAKLRQRVDELEKDTDCALSNTEGAFNQISNLKERLSEIVTPTPEGGKTTVQRHETPLEQVVAMPEHIVEEQLTANQERARFIASSITDYATKTPNGYILTAADLRSVLRAAYDTAHSETVDRVRTILGDLGGDDVEIQEPRTAGFSPDKKAEKRQKGKKLVVSSSLVQRLRDIDHDVVTPATA
jgi:DNA repair exonuclease SbcCD ATPase subunit